MTIDLKDYDKEHKSRRYICYLIDMHTRFLIANFIPNKKPCQIIDTILKKWIGAGYGIMNMLHNDLGGEMTNEELIDVASKLGVQMTTTAAYSPHQNGVNEHNHYTVDVMMKKMIESDSTLTPEHALFWAINAKNSLENHLGFSPYQLVFTTNPKFPSVTQCGPPGYENKTVSEIFAKDINTLHKAREEYIKRESCDILKKALKGRLYKRGDTIQTGDLIYYQRGAKKIWSGPNKVIGINGKKLFIDREGYMATVNRDNATRVGEEFWRAGDLDVSQVSGVEMMDQPVVGVVAQQGVNNVNRPETETETVDMPEGTEVVALENENQLLVEEPNINEELVEPEQEVSNLSLIHI